MSSGTIHSMNLKRFAEISAVTYRPISEPRVLMPICHGIAHQYAAYFSPCGSKERIGSPKKKNGMAISALKPIVAAAVLRISGRMSLPFAARAAVKGKSVKTSVLYRNPEMSENRVAM